MAMPQSESNLGGARFIPPLKRRGFSAPAPDDPKNTNLGRMPSRVLECVHGSALEDGRVPGAAWQLGGGNQGDWEDGGAVRPSPEESPPVRCGPRAWPQGQRRGILGGFLQMA